MISRIYRVAESLEILATQVNVFAAGAAADKIKPSELAEALDAIDILSAAGILAAMQPAKAADVLEHACPMWAEYALEEIADQYRAEILGSKK